MMKIPLTINPAPIVYELLIGENLSSDPSFLPFFQSLGKKIFLIGDRCIKDSFAFPLYQLFKRHGLNINCLFISEEEKVSKSRKMKAFLEDRLFTLGYGREDALIAVGGGMLIDIVGFLAATYCRGIPYVSFPTTLLAMTDAAVGGKTGVNHPKAKNAIGSIYHPKKVFMELNTLETLPERDFRSGLAEVIKYGLIQNPSLFSFVEENLAQFFQRSRETLLYLITESCKAKKNVVELDEKEKGLRRLLNFGHTLGHALELYYEFTFTHGECVALGMLLEAFFSHELGYLAQADFERICTLISAAGFVCHLPFDICLEALLPFLKRDKKASDGAVRCVLLEGIGKPLSFSGDYVGVVSEELLTKGIQWIQKKPAFAYV